jgi:hypothetical protein
MYCHYLWSLCVQCVCRQGRVIWQWSKCEAVILQWSKCGTSSLLVSDQWQLSSSSHRSVVVFTFLNSLLSKQNKTLCSQIPTPLLHTLHKHAGVIGGLWLCGSYGQWHVCSLLAMCEKNKTACLCRAQKTIIHTQSLNKQTDALPTVSFPRLPSHSNTQSARALTYISGRVEK